MTRDLVVTGSSGFIGTALRRAAAGRPGCRTLGLDLIPSPPLHGDEQFALVNICSEEELRSVAERAQGGTLVHLAAVAEAVTPWNDIGELFATNVNGFWRVLDTLRPSRAIFASSCAVYGNAFDPPARPGWDNVRPVGVYGLSKSVGEILLREWVEATGGSAIILRFGNVIGAGCRGLIPYLVKHTVSNPVGGTPAQMRGDGKIVRDYVPVDHVVGLILAAVDREWPGRSTRVYNVGTGRGTSNGTIARMVQTRLRERGLALHVQFDNPIAHGEAAGTILNVDETTRDFDVEAPSWLDVQRAVEASTDDHLARSR